MSNSVQTLSQLIGGYCSTQAIYVAAKLGIADLLVAGPQTVAVLAQRTNTHPKSLYRLLRMLASLGIFAETESAQNVTHPAEQRLDHRPCNDAPGRSFELTHLGELLRSDVPNSQRAMAIMSGEEHYQSWGELLYSARTGNIAFDKLYGQPIFEYMAEHLEAAANFDRAMISVHGRETDLLLKAYDFSQFSLLADIGGGNGSVLAVILKHTPALRGLLFDLGHVIDRARSQLEAAGLASRCELKSGSFFESVPVGPDGYFMRHIIHDWDDQRALTILRHCRASIPRHGKLLIAESIIPPGNQPFVGKILDLTMLVLPGGQERTEAEYRALLAQAGFEIAQIIPTAAEISIIECVPI